MCCQWQMIVEHSRRKNYTPAGFSQWPPVFCMLTEPSAGVLRPAQLVLRIAGCQFAVGLLGGLVWGIFSTLANALAAVSGGVIGAGLTLIFALYALRRQNRDPRSALANLFKGAAIKLGLAALVFGLAAKGFPAHYPALLSTFVPGLASYWLALLWQSSGKRDAGE